MDPTNSDTFFARNHLRKLMSLQHATAAGMLPQLDGGRPSKAGATVLACENLAACARKAEDSGQSASSGAPSAVETGEDTSSRAPTSDILRVMAACSAASQKLQTDADLALQQACLPGPPTLLDIERLRETSKHVAVRALSGALAVCSLLSTTIYSFLHTRLAVGADPVQAASNGASLVLCVAVCRNTLDISSCAHTCAPALPACKMAELCWNLMHEGLCRGSLIHAWTLKQCA